MKEWTVAYTQPRQENMAEIHLTEQGFDIFIPRYKKIRNHARKVDSIIAPLFPRYIFVGYDNQFDRWRSIHGTRGISYLLMKENSPAKVPYSVIEHLKIQQTVEGVVPINTLSLFVTGDKIRILNGVFEGQIAVFEKMDDKQRVALLLNFLGRDTKICLPLHAIEAI